MATYRLMLKIKDINGNEKVISGGEVTIDLTKLTEKELDHLAVALDPIYTKEDEVSEVVTEAISNTTTIKYSNFDLKEDDAE